MAGLRSGRQHWADFKLAHYLKMRETALLVVKIEKVSGTEIIIFAEETRRKVEKKLQAALRAGHTIVLEDKRQQWYDDDPLYDTSKQGPDCYTWNEAGNKVLTERTLVIRFPDGREERQILRRIWTPPW